MRRSKQFPFGFGAGMLIGIVAVFIIGGYTLYAAFPYLMGPSLTVVETTQKGETTITGSTARVAFLSIDDAPIALQEDGTFTVIRAYPLGYTAIKISVKDRFGRTLTKMITFLNT